MLSKFARSKIMPPHTDCDCLIFSTVHKNKIRWFHCSISSNFFCCAFSNAFRNPFLKQMQTHIHYISLTFLHCTVRFQMLSKIACPKKRHNHICSICLNSETSYSEHYKITLVPFPISSIWISKTFKFVAQINAKSHCLHLYDFKCFLKSFSSSNA